MRHERLKHVDIAKGLAIFLVVVGHIVARPPMPIGNEWYGHLKYLVYRFHMPFFMFVSGFVMFYSYKSISNIKDYMQYVKNKFVRLMIAFLLFGVLIGAGKYIFKNFMYVDNSIGNPISGFLNLLLCPMHSYAASLWYVYVLFIYFLLIPIALTLFKNKCVFLVFIGLFIHFIPTTSCFSLDLVNEYLFFFSSGMLCAEHKQLCSEIIDKHKVLFVLLFALSFVLVFVPIDGVVSKFVIGSFSIPAIFSIIRSKYFFYSNFWEWLGKYTFPIYLMNTIMIGLTKGIILKFIPWDGVNFYFIAPVLLISGIFVPIFIKRVLISKSRIASLIVA